MADYTVSTTTAAREKALTWQAQQLSKTNMEMIQQMLNGWLDERIDRLKEARQKALTNGYNNATPSDQAKIEMITGPLP